MPRVHQQRVAWGLRWKEQEWAREKEGRQCGRREWRPVGFKSLANLEQIKLYLCFFFFLSEKFGHAFTYKVSELHYISSHSLTFSKDSLSLGMVLEERASHSTSRSTFAPTEISVRNFIKKIMIIKFQIKLHVCNVEKHGNLTWLQRSCRKVLLTLE